MVGSKTTKARKRPVHPKALAGLGIFLYPIDLPTLSDDFAVIQRSKARHWPAHVTHGLFGHMYFDPIIINSLKKTFVYQFGIKKLKCLSYSSWNFKIFIFGKSKICKGFYFPG